MSKKFTIKRSEWLRGDEYKSRLLREEDGLKCCLGFFALACGLEEEDIRNKVNYADLYSYETEGLAEKADKCLPVWAQDTWAHRSVISELLTRNDDPDLSEEEREKVITRLFNRVGVEVEFVD